MTLPTRIIPALQVKRSHVRLIESAAEAAYPEECCGLLLGRPGDAAARVVTRLEPTRNALPPDERRERFAIDPKHLLRAERAASARGEVIFGFYHSHPDHPARPSDTDLDAAWPYYSYIIVSVGPHGVREMNGWVLDEAASAFVAQDIETAW